MKGRPIIFTLLVLFSSAVNCVEQKEFLMMFMENFVEEADNTQVQDVEIYVASRTDEALTVTIDNPNNNLFQAQTLTLATDRVNKFTVTANIRHQENEAGSSKAVRVVCSTDCIVYALNRNMFSTDGFTVYNTEQIGNHYYAISYSPARYNTQIGLLASEPGTTLVVVTLINSGTVTWQGNQYSTGDSFGIALQQYQTAEIQSTDGDLTGVRLTSDVNFAAFSGNVRTYVDGDSRDHLAEQLPPITQWGYDYYTIRTPQRTSDRPDILRIVAKEQNTFVTITGATTEQFTLNEGEYREVTTYGSTWVNADKTIMVAVIVSSQSKVQNNDIGDPSMVIIPAVGQYSADYTFSTPLYTKPFGAKTDSYTITLMIVAHSAEFSQLQFNNQQLSATWTKISGTNYSYAYYNVNENQRYTLKHPDSDARFMALLYGSADRESFYFPIDVGMININVVIPVEVYGQRGSTGSKGAAGSAGVRGVKGSKGLGGLSGERGQKGQKGSTGEPGADGQSSSDGVQGAQGATGGTGATGLQGNTGLPGAPGSVGAPGPIGAPGPRGQVGSAGVQGGPGLPGAHGETGYRGVEGSKGEKGKAGAKGETGEPGPPGVPGEKGSVDASGCTSAVCSVQGSSATASCMARFGSVNHVCSCPTGFTLIPPHWDECIDVDECSLEFCSHACVNSIGSYECSCPEEGYSLAADNRNCMDVNECNTNGRCSSGTVCINGIGSYVCVDSTDSSPSTSSLGGLQSLYSDEFFQAVLALLIVITILVIILALCLIVRQQRRYSLEKRRKKLAVDHAQVMYPVSAILQAGMY